MTDAGRRVVSRDQVVRAGVAHFLDRSTLDMEALAGELAISRATLYRVVGSRDALLGDVLAAITVAMLADARAARTETGFEGVVQVSRHFGDRLRTPVVKRFLTEDPEAAASLMFLPAGAVHDSAVAAQIEIFRESGFIAELRPDADIALLAYLYVRTVGTFLYAELFTGRRPDFDLLVPALRSMLLS